MNRRGHWRPDAPQTLIATRWSELQGREVALNAAQLGDAAGLLDEAASRGHEAVFWQALKDTALSGQNWRWFLTRARAKLSEAHEPPAEARTAPSGHSAMPDGEYIARLRLTLADDPDRFAHLMRMKAGDDWNTRHPDLDGVIRPLAAVAS